MYVYNVMVTFCQQLGTHMFPSCLRPQWRVPSSHNRWNSIPTWLFQWLRMRLTSEHARYPVGRFNIKTPRAGWYGDINRRYHDIRFTLNAVVTIAYNSSPCPVFTTGSAAVYPAHFKCVLSSQCDPKEGLGGTHNQTWVPVQSGCVLLSMVQEAMYNSKSAVVAVELCVVHSTNLTCLCCL